MISKDGYVGFRGGIQHHLPLLQGVEGQLQTTAEFFGGLSWVLPDGQQFLEKG